MSLFNVRWHFNSRGRYTGQSLSPDIIGYLGVFGWALGAIIGIFAIIFLFPLGSYFIARYLDGCKGTDKEFLWSMWIVGMLVYYLLMQFVFLPDL